MNKFQLLDASVLSIQEVLDTVDVQIMTLNDGRSIIKDADGEIIAVFGDEDKDSADAHFASLLSPIQLEAIELDSELRYEMLLEEHGNREIAGQW